ncbi:MAG: DMT family transporter [Pseudomonadota bacterium]
MTNQTKSYCFALATIACWSTIASASKITLRYISPEQLLFYSSLVSTLVLFIVLGFQDKWHTLRKLTQKDWISSIGFGLLNPFAYYLILFKAYDLLPAQQAQVINYTWAITLSLLSIPLLGQKVSGRQWLAIGLSYCGVLVIATRGNIFSLEFDNPLGVGLALISTIIWALYWILNTKDKRDPVLGLFLNFFCALPFIALYIFFFQEFGQLPMAGYAGAVYIGIFEMGLAFVLWLLALKLTANAARIANLIFIAPFGSLILIHFFVGETIFYSTCVGLFFVISGLFIQSFHSR